MQDTLGGIGRSINAFTFEAVPPPMYPDEQGCGLLSCAPSSSIFEIDPTLFQTPKTVRDYINTRLRSSRDETPIASILRSYNTTAKTANHAGCLTDLPAEWAVNERAISSITECH
jgi:hypothetical protein